MAKATDDRDVGIKPDRKDAVKHLAAQVDGETRSEFERRYSLWQNACRAPHIAFMSNPYAARETKTFWDLVEMGEKILPLVVEKLTEDPDWGLLPLYEEIQPDKALHFTDQTSRFEGEQMRAKRTVARWVEVSQRG